MWPKEKIKWDRIDQTLLTLTADGRRAKETGQKKRKGQRRLVRQNWPNPIDLNGKRQAGKEKKGQKGDR